MLDLTRFKFVHHCPCFVKWQFFLSGMRLCGSWCSKLSVDDKAFVGGTDNFNGQAVEHQHATGWLVITDHIDFDDRKDIEQCKIYIEYIQALTHHQHLQTTCAVPHTSHGRRLCHKSASVLAPPRAVLHNWRRRNQCGNSGAPSGHSPILPPPTPHYTAPTLLKSNAIHRPSNQKKPPL